MGTTLFEMGLGPGDPPELWNINFSNQVLKVHNEFIDAGSDIILTNSFGANGLRLKLHNMELETHKINLASAKISREAVKKIGTKILICGSMGPTGELIEPLGPLTMSRAVEVFGEQAFALKEGGVDAIWIETISSKEELLAAINGALPTGLPIIITMSFDTAGKTMMGFSPVDLTNLKKSLGSQIIAFGANCGVGPATLVSNICDLGHAAGKKDILVAKGNCGIPEFKEGKVCYSGSTKMMASYASLCRNAGASIIGGCCGTTAAHIKAIAVYLKKETVKPPPTIKDIEMLLGSIDRPKRANQKKLQHRRQKRRF
mgnify:CR=1 FL=1